MRVERLPEYVTTVTVTAAGIAFALYCGGLTGSGQTQILFLLFGLIGAIALMMTLRSAIWVLIPIFWALPGSIPALPVPLGLRDVVILFVVSAFFLLKALKVVRFKSTYTHLDGLLLANLLYLATVFVRNPVGTYFFESERVGGRPYLNVAIAFAGYMVLSQAHAGVRLAKWLPWGMAGATMIEGLLGIIAAKFPSFVPLVSRFYGSTSFAVDTGGPLMNPAQAQGSGRNTMFMYLGPPIVAALYSRFRPTTLLNPLYFVRFLLFAAGVLLILLSGFRSLVLSASAGFLIASYFRGGTRTVVRLCSFGALLMVVLVGMQGTFFQLPRPAQRALSFLPGNWDPVAVVEAQHSTEWRLHMWKTVWSSDRFIKNKLLGDGIGFNAVEMNILARAGYLLTPEDVQESYMVMGEYHSGPLSTIRDVGVVGLLLFTSLLVLIAKEAWMLIRKAQGGPFEFLSLFVGVPLIYEPFGYLVVYGSFKEAIVVSIFSVGMLKMLKNSLLRHDSRSDFPRLGQLPGNTHRHRQPPKTGNVLTSKPIHS